MQARFSDTTTLNSQDQLANAFSPPCDRSSPTTTMLVRSCLPTCSERVTVWGPEILVWERRWAQTQNVAATCTHILTMVFSPRSLPSYLDEGRSDDQRLRFSARLFLRKAPHPRRIH